MKPIILTQTAWNSISMRILREIGPRANIRWVQKRELGFTVRHHTDGRTTNDNGWDVPDVKIHLDFYDEAMRTFFILKYMGAQDES